MVDTLLIRKQHPPTRCDICHQVDQFDPETGVCLRCQQLPSALLVSTESQGEPPAGFQAALLRLVRMCSRFMLYVVVFLIIGRLVGNVLGAVVMFLSGITFFVLLVGSGVLGLVYGAVRGFETAHRSAGQLSRRLRKRYGSVQRRRRNAPMNFLR